MAEPTQASGSDPAAQVPTPTANNPATNRLLYIGVGFAALVVVASVVLGLGESPDTKLTLFKWGVSAGGIVLAAALTAAGYSIGKLFEGVTPAGFLPRIASPLAQVFTAPASVSGGAVARDLRTGEIVQPVPGGIPGEPLNLTPEQRAAMPRLDPLAPNNPGEWVTRQSDAPPAGPVARSLSGGLLALLFVPLFALAGGCAGTSAQFQGAIPAGVNNVVQDMREYNAAHDWDTNHNGTVEPAEAAQRAAENALTDALAASVADQKAITVEGVEAAWRPVEPRWRAYVSNDPLIAGDPESIKIRNDTGYLIEKLIQVEKERQAAVKQSIPFIGGK
jgi:hypothetical protein